jgi:hypothetical protein
MYNPKNKQYIFKLSSGKTLNFYYDNKSGLCLSALNKRGAWSETICLQKNPQEGFYVDIDYDDRLYILLQDKDGNILLSCLNGNDIDTTPILNSKSPTLYNKHLFLIPSGNSIHTFYTLLHNDSLILAHQVIGKKFAETPRVIDYVINTDYPFTVVSDKSSNIYAFYQASDSKYLQLGYKKFSPIQKNWGEFNPITRYSGDCEFPHALTDNKDVIHITYQRRSTKLFELVYQQKIVDKNLWTNEVVISSSAYSYENASIIMSNDKLIIFWIRDDVINYSSSHDSGSSWSKPARYNMTGARQLLCVSYKSNSPYETDKVIAGEIPCTFINGLKLAFYQYSSNRENNLSPEELRNMIVDSLKMLKSSNEELMEKNAGLLADIQGLKANHQKIEKELVKYSVKLNLLEGEIGQLKTAANQTGNHISKAQD